MADDGSDAEARLRALDKEHRVLTRKLARMDSNVRQMEEMQDATSKIMSGLIRELGEERARSRALLLNILPQAIVDRLESGEHDIADRFDEVTVLFGDLVGFTAISSGMDAPALVAELNGLFSRFDELCERTGVEKIKTIGDAYMAVGGLAGTRRDHAAAIAELALGMVDTCGESGAGQGPGWRIRVGLHTGPAVAGVIGSRKFAYDVWGDTVNVASRLESTSEPGRIHVSEQAASRLRDGFRLESRGMVELKGKGEMATYYLLGRR